MIFQGFKIRGRSLLSVCVVTCLPLWLTKAGAAGMARTGMPVCVLLHSTGRRLWI